MKEKGKTPMKRKTPPEVSRVVNRTKAIEKARPGYRDILDFFRFIMREQIKIKPSVTVAPVDMTEETAKHRLREGFSLLEKKTIGFDRDTAKMLFLNFCKGLRRKSVVLNVEAKKIEQAIREGEIKLEELFERVLEDDQSYMDFIANKAGVHRWLLSFLAEQSVKPSLEAYAEMLKGYVDQEEWWKKRCPICGSPPSIGELGAELGERFLLCSACSFKWRFKRVVCPFCDNDNHEKLRYFTTESDGKAYRVDVCDECKKYIKTIDLREVRTDIIPLIDDIGTLHLDMIAEKEGYSRGVPGFLELEKMQG